MSKYDTIKYPGPETLMPSEPEPVDVRLRRQRDEVQEHLNDLNAAIKCLEEQPKLLEALNVLRKVGI